ncbi:MAG: glycosyltransferase family 2 protein [Bacteroidales bacterium]|nr:glycosyltransferase family 2 protein [Bacteroidales bacterium]
MKKVTILVPVYNERMVLPQLIKTIQDCISLLTMYQWEVLFVDDGSNDDSLIDIKKYRDLDDRISYVSLSRNFGKEHALLAGLDYSQADAVIIMDADLQDPPSLIPEMLKWWEQGFDDVYAKRMYRGKESWCKKFVSLRFYKFLNKNSRFEILENVGDFRLLDKKCVNVICRMRESERYTKGIFCWIGYKKKEILFDRKDRIAGETKWTVASLVNLAVQGITSFSIKPLRVAIVMGLFVSFLSMVMMLYFFIRTLLWGDPVAGFPATIVIVLFLGGCQLFSIGIIGEYIGRIFMEVKKRPLYLVSEYNNSVINDGGKGVL